MNYKGIKFRRKDVFNKINLLFPRMFSNQRKKIRKVKNEKQFFIL